MQLPWPGQRFESGDRPSGGAVDAVGATAAPARKGPRRCTAQTRSERGPRVAAAGVRSPSSASAARPAQSPVRRVQGTLPVRCSTLSCTEQGRTCGTQNPRLNIVEAENVVTTAMESAGRCWPWTSPGTLTLLATGNHTTAGPYSWHPKSSSSLMREEKGQALKGEANLHVQNFEASVATCRPSTAFDNLASLRQLKHSGDCLHARVGR